jgi:hypothetical protein
VFLRREIGQVFDGSSGSSRGRRRCIHIQVSQ